MVGVGNGLFAPALSGLPVRLAPSSQLGNANALLGSAGSAAQVAGPALAGILIGLTSPALVIAVDAGTYAVSALALARLRFQEGAWRSAPQKSSVLRDMGGRGPKGNCIRAEALSRVGGFNMVGAYAFRPVAFVAVGPVSALLGARAVLAFGDAWSVTMTLSVLAAPAIRHQPWPEDPNGSTFV